LEYVKYGDAGFFGEVSKNEDGDLDRNIVPIMLIFTAIYITLNSMGYFVFDVVRELNSKVFNEFIRLRGKTD